MCKTKILLKRESNNWLDILFLKISFGKLSIPTKFKFFALSITFCISFKDKTELNDIPNVPKMNNQLNVLTMNETSNVPKMNDKLNIPKMNNKLNVPKMNDKLNVLKMNETSNSSQNE